MEQEEKGKKERERRRKQERGIPLGEMEDLKERTILFYK